MSVIGIAQPISGFTPEEQDRRKAIIRQWLPDDVDVRPLASPQSPRWLDSHGDFDEAMAAAVRFFAGVDPAEYDVIILAGALDPALEAIREASPVPVVGPGEAALHLAAIFGRPLSVVTVDEYAVAATAAFLDQTRVKPPITSVRSMETPVRVITQDRPAGAQALARECAAAVADDGAHALFLGSMTLGTLGMSERLHAQLGVPVFDPLRIAVATARQCLQAVGKGA